MQKICTIAPALLSCLADLQLKHRKHHQQETLEPESEDEFGLTKKFGEGAQPWITNLSFATILPFPPQPWVIWGIFCSLW